VYTYFHIYINTQFTYIGEMLSAMGGVEHEMYENFLNLCSKAYNILRKASGNILSMIRLMINAGKMYNIYIHIEVYI
jgi:phosphatidylinositol kinase/protein kinase (PI-3  family)